MSEKEKAPGKAWSEEALRSTLEEKMLVTSGARIGSKFSTPFMKSFIAYTRPDGLNLIDVSKTIKRLEVASKFITRANPKGVLVFTSNPYGFKPVEKFCELTGCVPVLRRFLPGILTNPSLGEYREPELVIVLDPLQDRQAVTEASKLGIPVIAICDMEYDGSNVDLIIPANNKGRKAIATIFWLLASKALMRTGAITSLDEMELKAEDFEEPEVVVEAEES